jgi:hypothetical protein
MYSTTAYLYQQIIRVLLIDTSGGYFTARYDPVYAKTLTVNKGVDNVLLFEFINQDQKPVNITGSTFRFRLLNQTGDVLLIEKDMTVLSASLGRVKVVLDTADTINILAQPASYSIERTQGNYIQAAFTDDNAGARADCNIVDSVLPQFIASQPVTIPTINGKNSWPQPGPSSWPDWALNPQPLSRNYLTEYYSSYINTTGASLTTIKYDLDHYTGTLKVQAAQDYEAVWVDVTESREYFDESGTFYINVVGFHPLLRLAINNSQGYGASATATVVDGVVTGIAVNNAGMGYMAAPYVQILGNGAGAKAVAAPFTGPSGIGAITVTNGGSGYLPLNFGGTEAQAVTVLITTGYVTNILYR